YATFGSKDWLNLQPLVANFAANSFAIAHNGNLINAGELRSDLEDQGAIFSATSDTEVILHLTARAGFQDSIAQRVRKALKPVKGAYSIVVMTLGRLIAVRDPSGVRPLSLGKIAGGYIVASETCAFDLVGATFVRDIEPGEILEIQQDGTLVSDRLETVREPAFCVFEYVYFARPDSVIGGRSVYEARKELGVELAREHPADVDIVVPVPDSGFAAALGYAQELKIPLELGLIRNHYVGRTFIEPKQSIRDFGVKVKLNPTASILKGKRIAVIDDSIVRGTTSKKLVKMLREAGAKEIHFRVSSPPTKGSCHYGIDTPSPSELIASTHTLEETCDYIKADTLGYLSNAGMFKAIKGEKNKHCDACFSQDYRLGIPQMCSISQGTVKTNQPKRRG
ncbi:UNVERIFIED_CONTAM: hypothetical protein GTU68_003238, partial [Idotea baltica]|nr:hypothetical protein [Idotea baltica]